MDLKHGGIPERQEPTEAGCQGKQFSEAGREKSSLGGIFEPLDPAMPEFL